MTDRASSPSGYRIRRCTATDVDAVVAFHSQRTDPADGEDFALVANDPAAGPGWTVIAVDGTTGDIAAALTLLDEEVRIGTTMVPAGQVEMVASAPEHEGRGLVRALMEWSERESARRGHLLAPMVGIPYFYRQFGYAYSATLAPMVAVQPRNGDVDPAVVVRRAALADAPAIRELTVADQAAADVAMAPSLRCQRWIIQRSGSESWVAERDGSIVATARILPDGEAADIGDFAAIDDAATHALLTHLAAGVPRLRVQHRPMALSEGALADWTVGPTTEERDTEWLYARIPDLVALLEHLRPELQRRLDESGLPDLPERLTISSYRSHVSADLSGGRIGAFSPGGPMQAPNSRGGAGIPPDVWAPLLLGPHGALGLEHLHPDVLLGPVRDLMGVLFPPVSADIRTFYLVT